MVTAAFLYLGCPISHKIDTLPGSHTTMVGYLKLSCRFTVTAFIPHHGLHDHLLELSCVSFVRYSFWHNKNTPFLSTSISYLSNKWGAVHTWIGWFRICLKDPLGRNFFMVLLSASQHIAYAVPSVACGIGLPVCCTNSCCGTSTYFP